MLYTYHMFLCQDCLFYMGGNYRVAMHDDKRCAAKCEGYAKRYVVTGADVLGPVSIVDTCGVCRSPAQAVFCEIRCYHWA